MRKLLLPLSLCFGLGVWLRNYLFDTGRIKTKNVGIPVISVGNLSVGGTGKTPMARFILSVLVEAGLRPGYLSRGYGRDSKGYIKVNPTIHSFRDTGDESLMIASSFRDVPVAVCEKRSEGGERLKTEEKINVLVLDDAFQHRYLYRDLDIVMLDANHLAPDLLPAGDARESLSALYRAEVVVVNHWKDEVHIDKITQRLLPYLQSSAILAFCRPFITLAVHPISGKSVPLASITTASAFSGIGNNVYFWHLLIAAGIQVSTFSAFSDHHSYTQTDFQRLTESSGEFLLTTEKDYYRLLNLSEVPTNFMCKLYFVPMEWEWAKGQKEIISKIEKILKLYDGFEKLQNKR